MSNLSELNGLTESDASGIKTFGALIGTIADFAGAIGAIVSVVSFVVNAYNNSSSDLDQIKAAIQAAFNALNAHQKAEDISLRLQNIRNQISLGAGVVSGLQADLAANLSLADRNSRLETCAQAIFALSSDAWYAPYDDQVYWIDWPDLMDGDFAGFGFGYCKFIDDNLATQPDGTGNVFSYPYILPAFLMALGMFLVEAIALDADLAEWADSVISPALQLLKDCHDKIANEGIVQLSPTPWSNKRTQPWDPLPMPLAWTGDDLLLAAGPFYDTENLLPDSGALSGVTPIFRHYDPNDEKSMVAGVAIEYGAVEKFSGYSQMGTYVFDVTQADGAVVGRQENNSIVTNNDPETSSLDPYKKFQLRLLKKTKDVYRGVGLLDLWKSINAVRSILAQAPLARPNPGDWSFRAISDIVGPDTEGKRSFSGIRKFIENTPLYDLPEDYWTSFSKGFRSLLDISPTYQGSASFVSIGA